MGIFKKLFNTKLTSTTPKIIPEIDYKEGTLFAKNNTTKVYVDIDELGGFSYLKTVLIGSTEVNIKKNGCTISLVLENEEITLASDHTEIASDEINKSGTFYTSIDFELDENEVTKITEAVVTEIKYRFKNKVVTFKTI